MRLTIETFNLQAVERSLCVEALNEGGSIVGAAALLGITRHSLKRRITKHNITWPVRRIATAPGVPGAVLVSSSSSSSSAPTSPAPFAPATTPVAAPSFSSAAPSSPVVLSAPRIIRQ